MRAGNNRLSNLLVAFLDKVGPDLTQHVIYDGSIDDRQVLHGLIQERWKPVQRKNSILQDPN